MWSEEHGPFSSTGASVMRFSFFPYSIKMLATDAKTQKIEPGPNLFITDESFGGSV